MIADSLMTPGEKSIWSAVFVTWLERGDTLIRARDGKKFKGKRHIKHVLKSLFDHGTFYRNDRIEMARVAS